MLPLDLALSLLAALAAGLMLGVERGWQLRGEPDGSRVAGVRTFALIGAAGGLAALLGRLLHPLVAVAIAGTAAGLLLLGYARAGERSVTNMLAAAVALALGLVAGADQPMLAVAFAAVVTLLLAARQQLHGLLERLGPEDVQAFARYAVIVAAVLPFLPNRSFGPYGAWNPFQLWLVVVLVTGFSFAGYIANRLVGASKGTLATALIGGAYSSTAVTATLARRIGAGEPGPYAAGIALATAVMYLRVALLMALLSPSTLPAFALLLGPAAIAGWAAALCVWLRERRLAEAASAPPPGNPVELLPALGFVVIVAAGALLTRWAQARFGSSGTAVTLFITGSFDVDASIVTLGQLSVTAIARDLAALAVAGTILANMGLKIGVVVAYAGRKGRTAALALSASTAVLLVTAGLAALRL
ncbi:DUF4010 domain-containing protein [Sphingomonas sp. BN140010]|uniref:DUF4010 domain-containing protein n=1 Tax=Sphingomonas arvum TaxID=2992113 RepID=A0ABT3JC62_9SPHN|nr:DUF4010 domain-containing protein [Sphingomonas sp. BN140010]MCW3796655.1 DUF4010 domain-containing protein [Sphingomonas sp. BN140010]